MEVEKPRFGTRQWFENYWYHYKWHTIAGIFAAFLVVTFVHDLVTREKFDAELMLAGQTYADYSIAGRMALLLDQYSEDFDGDGVVNVGVVPNVFPVNDSNIEMMMAAQTKFMAELSDGKSMIMILDDYTYDLIGDESFFADLSEFSDKVYDGGKKLRLSDTALGEDPMLEPIAERYFLVLRAADSHAASKNEGTVANYQNQVRILKNLTENNIVNPFELPPPTEPESLF